MSVRYAILMLILMLPGYAVHAGQPIIFARSGATISIPVPSDKHPLRSVVLQAYGRIWTSQGVLDERTVRIEAPTVRVPTVFRLAPPYEGHRTLGHVVVYPKAGVAWDKEIALNATGAPEWFNQWARATGLPVKHLTEQGFRNHVRKSKVKRSLLVIGRKYAGKKFADVLAVAKKYEMSILVLDASWFGSKSGKFTVGPKQMVCELAVIAKQKWPEPVAFSSSRLPWSGISNRRAWITSKDGRPLVEEIANMTQSWKVVVSYLPWAEQLGRCEAADNTFRSVLSAAAEPARKLPQRMSDILYPSQKVLKESQEHRPVLTAASEAWDSIKDIPSRVYIIDLRGRTSPPPEFGKTLKWLANRDGKSPPLLVLGDDPLLDKWKWAKIDRKQRASKRSGVLWLPDDALPPSEITQIKLMLKLTELGVFLKL